ncbi:hypothetical protein GCM10010330_14270 [Streptomyces tendae]|nr:hypothetical protein GCM10010330_14270 [Streptomyces tendae]
MRTPAPLLSQGGGTANTGSKPSRDRDLPCSVVYVLPGSSEVSADHGTRLRLGYDLLATLAGLGTRRAW